MKNLFSWLIVLACASFSFGAEVKTRDAVDEEAEKDFSWGFGAQGEKLKF